jgi:hypothetical protein
MLAKLDWLIIGVHSPMFDVKYRHGAGELGCGAVEVAMDRSNMGQK